MILPANTAKRLLKAENPKQQVTGDAVEAFQRYVEVAARAAARSAGKDHRITIWDVVMGFKITGTKSEGAL